MTIIECHVIKLHKDQHLHILGSTIDKVAPAVSICRSTTLVIAFGKL